MKLTYFTVSYFRSITDAYKIPIHNMTVFLGKNNEGKTNLIKALRLAMDIIRYVGDTGRKIMPPRSYNWEKDFPIGLQNNKRIKKKETQFRLDFSLNENEKIAFNSTIGSYINGDLSIFVVIKDNRTVSITMPKRGKNTKSLTNKICEISKFIYNNTNIQFIPAIRSEKDVYSVINELIEDELSRITDPKYVEAQEYIKSVQMEKLNELSGRIKKPLETFMPQIKSINIQMEDRTYHSMFYRRDASIYIDDGVKTNLEDKGDGIKNLTTMAVLSQTDTTDRIIIVDEPEAHLHPEAIHYLRKVLYELADKNQIIISTHNPIFINRFDIRSNIIVENGKATPANRIDEIRKCLGVMMSDNLAYSDYVIVVEGLTDKSIITSLIQENTDLHPLIQNNAITVHAVGGTNNLKAELFALERYMCKYLVLLDNDEAGKNAAKEAQQCFGVDSSQFRFFIGEGMRESELEDLFNPDCYKDFLLNDYQTNITKGQFRNKSKKWSKRIEEIAGLAGRIISDADIDNIKTRVNELVLSGIGGSRFNEGGRALMESIIEKIKNDVKR